jgi:hypothetical protein
VRDLVEEGAGGADPGGAVAGRGDRTIELAGEPAAARVEGLAMAWAEGA